MATNQALHEYLEQFRIWLADAGFDLAPSTSSELWRGCIGIEWENAGTGFRQLAEHCIFILLPQSFPYNPPIVISNDEPPLKSSWHLNPNPVNSLCLWPPENGWQPHFTAQYFLNRIQEWFHCYHTGDWPQDAQMPDLYAYLKCVGAVVIGEEWQPSLENKSGQFVLWQKQGAAEQYLCLASTDSKNSSVKSISLDNRLHKIIAQAHGVKTHLGTWFRLETEFVPPQNTLELLDAIDIHANMEAGWAKQQLSESIGQGSSSSTVLPIALGYKDGFRQERWLFLWGELLPNSHSKKKSLHWATPEQIILKSMRTLPAKKADLLRRTAYLSDSLSQRKAIVFGLGALGSSIALLLAKSGFGELKLVDNDMLIPTNVVRHACGLDWVGFKKTVATQQLCLSHNPDCVIHYYDATWEISELTEYIRDCDMVIDATANSNFSLHLNDVCLDMDKPLLFSSAYHRAKVGRIIIRRNGNDPCFACYSNPQLWDEVKFPTIPPAPQETFIEDGCGSVTQEATALDVEAIANLTARIVIKVVQQRLEGNLAILVNEKLEKATGMLAEEGIHWRLNSPLAGCQMCIVK